MASDDLDRMLRKEMAAFRDALRGNDGTSCSGQVGEAVTSRSGMKAGRFLQIKMNSPLQALFSEWEGGGMNRKA